MKGREYAIKAVANGTPIGNAMKFVGRFSLQSGLNAGMVGAAGVYFLGPAGAAVPAVASLARWGATVHRRAAAQKALDMMAKGPE